MTSHLKDKGAHWVPVEDLAAIIDEVETMEPPQSRRTFLSLNQSEKTSLVVTTIKKLLAELYKNLD